jgi:hypothetical protein
VCAAAKHFSQPSPVYLFANFVGDPDASFMGWPPLERLGAYTGVAWVSFRGFDERGVAGRAAGLWRAAGMRGGPAAWVGELRDLRRGFVVVVLCLNAGRAGTQRGRQAMQLFPLCGV